jgi:valyl-tRNA synthetase
LNKAFQGEGRKLLLLQPWPNLDKKLYDKAAMKEIDWLCRLITEIRSVRSDMNVPASQNVRLIVNNASAETKACLGRYKANLAMMAKINEIEMDVQNPPKGSIQSVVDEATIMLPIAELIDLDKERDRLKKQISKLEQELKGIQQRLDNKQFVANAPDEVVAEQKEKAQELEATLGKFSSALKQLEAA